MRNETLSKEQDVDKDRLIDIIIETQDALIGRLETGAPMLHGINDVSGFKALQEIRSRELFKPHKSMESFTRHWFPALFRRHIMAVLEWEVS